MKSYLLSALTRRFQTQTLDAFQHTYADDWLLWEPGTWRPGNASTILLKPEQALPAQSQAGEALALVLESSKAELTLGRGDQCDFLINDGTVSQVHLTFARNGKGWSVRDAGSRNGSWLNGGKIQPGAALPLVNSAQLRAGQVMMTYYAPSGMWARLRQAPAPR